MILLCSETEVGALERTLKEAHLTMKFIRGRPETLHHEGIILAHKIAVIGDAAGGHYIRK